MGRAQGKQGFTPSSSTADTGLSLRTIILGTIFCAMICALTPLNVAVGGTFLGGNHFPVGPVFLLLAFVTLINPLLSTITKKWEFTGKELVVVFVMTVVASGIPFSGLARYLFPTLVVPGYFATPENEWKELFGPSLSSWLIPTSVKAINGYAEGDSGEAVPWSAWTSPLVTWTALVLILYLIMACLSIILRKQWIEHERFTFPLVQIPAEMVQRPGGGQYFNAFFRSGVMWVGFALPVVIHSLNGLHAYFPFVPQFTLWFSLDQLLQDRPWTAMRPFYLPVYLSVIGFSYLITLEVAFSLWFFFLIYKVECLIGAVFGASMGYSAGGHARAFAAYQEIGGYIVLVAFIVLASKNQLKVAFSQMLSGKNTSNMSGDEPLPYRFAVIGLICSILLYACLSNLLGMSFWVALSIILLFCLVCIVLTWAVTNGGLLLVHYSLLPEELIETVFGSRRMGANNLTILALQSPILMRDLREFMMPNFLNGFRLADTVRLPRKQLLWAMGLAIAIALGVTYYTHLQFAYEHGGLNTRASFWAGQRSFGRAVTLILAPTETNWTHLFFVGVGSVVMFFLVVMKRTFLWWPFHPIGYTMPSGFAIKMLWFSFFLGWLFKFIILKYGGLKTYRKMRPGFLGLALGEAFIGGIWFIVGLMTGTGYRITVG